MSAAIVKFKTGGYRETIERVECVRETDSSVFTRDSFGGPDVRHAKNSTSIRYCNTWAEAHAHVLAKAEANVAACRRSLERAHDKLGNIKGMKPPKDAQ